MHLTISPELERIIAEQAAMMGYASPEAFLRAVIEGVAHQSPGARLSNDQFDQLLNDLASDDDLPTLPADFSRADIYSDHD